MRALYSIYHRSTWNRFLRCSTGSSLFTATSGLPKKIPIKRQKSMMRMQSRSRRKRRKRRRKKATPMTTRMIVAWRLVCVVIFIFQSGSPGLMYQFKWYWTKYSSFRLLLCWRVPFHVIPSTSLSFIFPGACFPWLPVGGRFVLRLGLWRRQTDVCGSALLWLCLLQWDRIDGRVVLCSHGFVDSMEGRPRADAVRGEGEG